MTTLRIEAGDQTEDLIQFVTKELDDATLDEIDISREVSKPSGLASEPITISVTFLGIAAIVAVTRLVERWLENKRQGAAIRMLVDAPTDEVRRMLVEVEKKHADVSIEYKLTKESWDKKE